VGPGPKWIVFSRADVIEVWSLIGDQPIATKPIAAGSYLPCPVGHDHFALATGGGTIVLFSLPDLQEVATCDFPNKILQIRSSVSGDVFTALNEDGLARVFSREGKQLAEHKFTIPPSVFDIYPTVDISPSGRTVVFDPGLQNVAKTKWLWQSGVVTKFPFDAYGTRLKDDETAIGYVAQTSATQQVTVLSIELPTDNLVQSGTTPDTLTLYSGENFIYFKGARLAAVAGGLGTGEPVLISEHGINLIESAARRLDANNPERTIGRSSTLSSMIVTRYLSLWPHAKAEPGFLAFDDATRTLALSTNDDILIFTRGLPAALGATLDLSIAYWNFATSVNCVFTMDGNSLSILDYQTLERKVLSIPRPETANDKYFLAWGIAVTPDAHWAAILWQETSKADAGRGNAGYYRKLVRVYELSQPHASPSARLAGEVGLKDFFGLSGRSNRELVITPDAKVIAFADSAGLICGYRIADGSRIYKMKATAPNYAVCPDPPLLGVHRFRGARPRDADYNSDYRVWDLQSGKLVVSIPLSEPTNRSAFSPDGKTLYISDGSKLAQYRTIEGKLLREVDSPVAPVSISPTGDRFLGFVPDALPLGSIVLADLTDGRSLDVLNPAVHILNHGDFSPDGRTFAFVMGRNTCRVLKSLDVPEANAWLEHQALDAALAATSTDFLDYRMKLATQYRDEAAELAKNDDRAAALSAYRKALSTIQLLAGSFPRHPDLSKMLADTYDEMATVADTDSLKVELVKARDKTRDDFRALHP
jgi:WD40 repeat protein